MSGIIGGAGSKSGIIGTTEIDYEEGTFTPAIWIDSTISGVTQQLQDGMYTKVGNLVSCTVALSISNKGSGSGNVTFRGLPFTIKDALPNTSLVGGSAAFGYIEGLSGLSGLGMVCSQNTTYLVGYAEAGDNGMPDATFTNSHITNNFGCRFSFQYFTDL